MAYHLSHSEDYELIRSHYVGLETMARRLRARAGLHPNDPDALDQDEIEQLERLEKELEDI